MKTTMRTITAIAVSFLAIGLVAAAASWTWVFYQRNLTGIAPAIESPKEDIVELIDEREVPLTLPDGFSLGVFAEDLGDARVLVKDIGNVLLASIPSQGRVVALPDTDNDGTADRVVTVVERLNRPHGLAFRCRGDDCNLYIAEMNAVAMYDYDSATYMASNRQKLVDLPSGSNHTSRSLLFLPPPNENTLLVAVGSSCNVCHEQDIRRAKIMAINADGSGLRDYATGLRNSVFQTIRPGTNEVWVTEMGRDLLGDDTPPDEINILQEGKNFGWPICYGDNIHDVAFDKNTYIRNPCMEPFEVPSHIDIPAHSAPLGLAFADGGGWPSDYQGDLFVAYHGSWNRSVPTGYKVVRHKIGPNGESEGVEDFLTGFLTSSGALGRPVGLLTTPEGELFVSDDKSGTIYRVYQTGGASATQ